MLSAKDSILKDKFMQMLMYNSTRTRKPELASPAKNPTILSISQTSTAKHMIITLLIHDNALRKLASSLHPICSSWSSRTSLVFGFISGVLKGEPDLAAVDFALVFAVQSIVAERLNNVIEVVLALVCLLQHPIGDVKQQLLWQLVVWVSPEDVAYHHLAAIVLIHFCSMFQIIQLIFSQS